MTLAGRSPEPIGEVAVTGWRDLGGPADELGLIRRMELAVTLGSRLDVAGLAADSVALATLAVHRVLRARGVVDALPEVTVDGARLVTSIQSERHVRVDGAAPDAWAPLSGFWRTADGWVRTHGNYPHHAQRLRAILALGDDATREDAAAAILTRSAAELEDAAADAGAIVVRVRGEEEWARHPQAVALAGRPLIESEVRDGGEPRAWGREARRPLDGVRVLDLTRVIAGPVAARDLGYAGAEVLRVDAPQLPEVAWQHLDTGQGKRSTRLDLTDRRDAATLEDLLAAADVVVTGYRPGALDAFGLAPEALIERHPGLVVGRVSAWGTAGPWAIRRGFDSIVQAASGIALIESADGSTPGALPAQVLDHGGGHLLAAGLIRGLEDQRREGGGRIVQLALARVAAALLAGPRTAEPPPADVSAPTLQHGQSGGVPLVTALPVLAYAGAPGDYPEIGRPWGADPPEWSGARPGGVGL